VNLITGRNPVLPTRSDIYTGTVKYHEDLPATLAPVLGGETPTSARVPPAGLVKEDAHYVTNTLRNRRYPNDPNDHALVSFGLEPEGEVRPDPTEDDVLNGQRVVILGEPGSGKSALLRSLAKRTKAPKTGLYIRLAEVELDETLGPRETLARWSRAGLASIRGSDVSPEALERGRYHFFLDGLDEVRSGGQRALSERINGLAGELPQHAFTVSTRPLPWLALLSIEAREARNWDQFALQPDVGWRDRYLAERDAGLELLEAQMPALTDMDEVLTTPFYLRHIVDLHERGRLGGQRDVADLLSTLLDSAISRDQGGIDLEPDAIRLWLQRVALAAAIAQRQTLSSENLRRFPAPAGSDLDPVKLAKALEHRLLIAEDSSGFRFQHRLFAEQLAAERLTDAGPTQELLNCFVPYLDDRLSGVRPDAIVPVGLACMRSPKWRRAVAERAPLAAARATPAHASVRERSAALRTLWEHAKQSQVWVWQYGTAFTDDAEAMVRLVRGLPSGAVVREMRRAIDNGTAQDQGNAIRVLARAGAARLKSKLKKVLRDPTRNGVVLRQAALAAAELGFDDLMEDITEMLVGQSESVVHQDGIIALKRLMDGEPRIDLYRRLMKGPEADLAYSSAARELDPPQRVLLLSAYLQADNEARDYLTRGDLRETFDELRAPELSTEVLEAAIEVALFFDLDRQHLEMLKVAEPEAALNRLALLIKRHHLRWYEVVDLAALFEPDELRSAKIPDDLIGHAEQRREADEMRARRPAGRLAQGPGRVEDENGPEEPPTLAELLADPNSDNNIIRNANYFAAQVGDLNGRSLAELRRRLLTWWPKKPFHETIKRKGANQWSQEWRAAAWIWLGPPARPPLSSSQWGQLASCGILFATQSEWLREVETADGVHEAIAALGEEGDPERWGQLFDCCSDPVPNHLLVHCARSLAPKGKSEEGTTEWRLIEIARRFVESDRADLARSLAGRHSDFARVLAPVLAQNGDLQAQAELLKDLRSTVERGELPSEHRLSWLSAASSDAALGDLFAILRSSYRSAGRPRDGAVYGRDFHDVTNPTVEAIVKVGGRAAVEGYDRLISEGGDLRWLGRQRERVADAVLEEDSRRFAPGAAARVGLPLITDQPP
jgi:hypothetical protein